MAVVKVRAGCICRVRCQNEAFKIMCIVLSWAQRLSNEPEGGKLLNPLSPSVVEEPWGLYCRSCRYHVHIHFPSLQNHQLIIKQQTNKWQKSLHFVYLLVS